MMEHSEEGTHKRRKRYKGTHPKAFQEKYKELNPDLYAEDIKKIQDQGKTPAGMHRSICVDEILEILNIKSGQVGLDATLGYGGHSLEILQKLQPSGILYATDVDPIELPKTKERLEAKGFGPEKILIRKMNFSEIDSIVAESGELDFVLADLGVSSMQIDNPERGFTFKFDGPLDLRLNPKSGISAAELLSDISQGRLEEILVINSDEPYYQAIAGHILNLIDSGHKIETTAQLRDSIAEALIFIPKNERKEEVKKACQRVFQALRIEVNDEFGSLEKFLEKLPYALAPGGKVAILSFHSGEDRRVKKSFQYFYRQGIYSEIAPDPIRPTPQECVANPRAKSAKLRWAIRA